MRKDKQRIDALVEFYGYEGKYFGKSQEEVLADAVGTFTFHDVTLPWPKPLYNYASIFYGLLETLGITGKTVGFTQTGGLTETYSVGSLVGFWRDACFNYGRLLQDYQRLAQGYIDFAEKTPLTAERMRQIVDIIPALYLPALNSIQAPSKDVPHPCMATITSAYFAFHFAATEPGISPSDQGDLALLRNATIANAPGPIINWHRTVPNCSGDLCALSIKIFNGEEIIVYTTDKIYNFGPGGADLIVPLKLVVDTDNKVREELLKKARDAYNVFTGEALAESQKAEQEAKAAAQRQLQKGSAISLPLPLSDISPQKLVGRIISALLGVVGAVALAMFVYGGLRWMTAAGNPEVIKKARATIVWAALGLVMIFGAYAVVNFLLSSFG